MKCGLGEAPFYEASTNSLRFVDIVKEKLHVVELDKGPSSLKSYDLGTPVRLALCSCKDMYMADEKSVRLQTLRGLRRRSSSELNMDSPS